ncbi:uncharacterized protein [Brachionichthys hirsutus]|uniref:uncharacterized protein n=1 Tax=Brachionichthys hirsutus TaxID=412623 RepID=UPI0036045604
MASGIVVDNNVKQLYKDMKLKKSVKLAAFQIFNSKKIDVKTKLTEQEICEKGKDAFEEMQEQMKDDECAYFLYDCHFQDAESRAKSQLVLVIWSPDGADIRDKMIYSSCRDRIKEACAAKCTLEANGRSDCSRRALSEQLERITGVKVLTLEGKPCH